MKQSLFVSMQVWKPKQVWIPKHQANLAPMPSLHPYAHSRTTTKTAKPYSKIGSRRALARLTNALFVSTQTPLPPVFHHLFPASLALTLRLESPDFVGSPLLLISSIATVNFAGSQIRHFRGHPSQNQDMGFTFLSLLLTTMTVLRLRQTGGVSSMLMLGNPMLMLGNRTTKTDQQAGETPESDQGSDPSHHSSRHDGPLASAASAARHQRNAY